MQKAKSKHQSISAQADQVLQDLKIKTTWPRQLIIQALLKAEKPKTAEQLILQLNRKKKQLDKATVYRNLGLLEKAGLVRSFDLAAKDRFYQLQLHDQTHCHYVVCLQCRKLEDISDCLLSDQQIENIKKKKKFAEIKDHSLEFFGICQKCQK